MNRRRRRITTCALRAAELFAARLVQKVEQQRAFRSRRRHGNRGSSIGLPMKFAWRTDGSIHGDP